MAVQVAQAADPSTNPAASAFKDQMLSPVSKLEAARKQAALEQQKRVEQAVARMANVKSDNAGKRKLLEEKLDAHSKVKVQKTSAAVSTRAESTHSVTVASSASTSVSSSTTAASFATVTQAQQQVAEAASSSKVAVTSDESTAQQTALKLQTTAKTATVSASYDATAALLRATRSKLNDLVNEDEAANASKTETEPAQTDEGDWNGPSTNYHLKQLGLVKKKIDIYAPVEVQQQEIRRLRDRSRMASSTIVDAAATADDLDSENDSDFTPEVESENDDDDSDAESIPEVEAEETLELVKESAEHERKLQQQALLTKIPFAVLLVCLALVLALAVVEIAQQQLHFCPADAESDSLCSSFLQTRASVATLVHDAGANAYECAAASIAAVRASLPSEL